MQDTFSHIAPIKNRMFEALSIIGGSGAKICTLNYDTLAEQVTGKRSFLLERKNDLASFVTESSPAIMHLHGCWEEPSSCILGIRDYQKAIGSDVRDLFQRHMGAFNNLLFIGCGDTFEDPNFSNLIGWLRTNLSDVGARHFALVSSTEALMRDTDPRWRDFVDPLSYGDHYSDLPDFLIKLFGVGLESQAVMAPLINHDTQAQLVISEYLSSLIKDCGQMTLEGIRADNETAQRKFDLERLFVPLDVDPIPPDISPNDPDREAKLNKWHREHETTAFGEAFDISPKMAILALPGGGKTFLLKRLAVAYADAKRRGSSDDHLPELDLLPVLIRCREWRHFIDKPILSLLQHIDEITGNLKLRGLRDALLPHFEKGNVLLLVDGLDEIHDDGLRLTFTENLEKFVETYPNVRLVVTSREASFSLVAPSISRFCTKWRIAPLQPDTIKLLSSYWHVIMVANRADAETEAAQISQQILHTDALRRLAENPLLLTMLLVVKHSNGRLPPDKVSLYDRAVDVLLDTWNIKGHQALNVKESVPQLAAIAFDLMLEGRQTATFRELATILDAAREEFPHLKRIAKDDATTFLERVELRSSLLVEAGHQLQGSKPVPFYQFRHLTFQEYLAAIAAVDGHYLGYKTGDNLLTPLRKRLFTKEWKEVIPMAAVLAGKSAEPLMEAIVAGANTIKKRLLESRSFPEFQKWKDGEKLPDTISLLCECLAEGAQASNGVLAEAVDILAHFARGCRTNNGWSALARGPYGDELRDRAWELYVGRKVWKECWIRNTYGFLSYLAHDREYWSKGRGHEVLTQLLSSENEREVVTGLLIICCSHWADQHIEYRITDFIDVIEARLFSEHPQVIEAACWAWGWVIARLPEVKYDTRILQRLLDLWTQENHQEMASFALSRINANRNSWRPTLSKELVSLITAGLDRRRPSLDNRDRLNEYEAALAVAFYSRHFSDKKIVSALKKSPQRQYNLPWKTQFGFDAD
ncbi:SIR2 family protein [Rhizobium esperanzae]|uniref:NACHT domain-containing protein n=1 Tax=Rhizobium esperanzae TaxID=1967781 RepID=A0A7W6R8E2_9HYPH|nr:SIR2 family protein [Rhizobium esperanzae]MBB4238599.1 hypothetical protein [Rhizobium esperanzae]